jgi:cytosol aminopeptidase
MSSMKGDMSGAASVVSAIIAAAKLQLPINVAVVVPLCENMPSGSAVKPGDVVVSMSGKTVEIEDTDAEGRLILADALHYTKQAHSPRVLLDVASLTGAMCVAVGPVASGLYTASDLLWERLERVSETSGDWIWRMPLWEEYRPALESKIADIRNVGSSRDGAANNAAQFLWHFVPEKQEWAHIDMASVMDINGSMTGKS